jgi:hypothetical protein
LDKSVFSVSAKEKIPVACSEYSMVCVKFEFKAGVKNLQKTTVDLNSITVCQIKKIVLLK